MNVMDVCKGTVKLSRQEKKRLILSVSLAEETWLPEEKKHLDKTWMESYHKENKAGWFIWEDSLGE